MTRAKKLLILIAVLIAVIAGYFAVSHFAGKQNSSGNNLQISDTDTADLRSIEWEYDSEKIKIVSEDGKAWVYDVDKEFPLDSDKAASIASSVSSIKAIKMIAEKTEDAAKFGLDSPKIKITVKTADGTESVYNIGNYNDAAGYYYFSKTGSDALYYVDSSLYTLFSVKLFDLAEYEYLPTVETGDVESFSIKCGGKTINVNYHLSGKQGENKNFTYYIDGSDTVCDTDIAEKLITGFTNISWLSCEAYNVSEKDLAKFGLDKPSSEFTINYKYKKEAESESGEESVLHDSKTLLIGKQSENGKYYAMIKGGKCVYTLNEDTAKNYIITSEENLYSRMLLNFTEEQLSKIDIEYRNTKYTVKTESTGEIEDEDIKIKYTVNDSEISLHSFITQLAALKADSVQRNEISGKGEKLIGVKLTLSDGSEQTLDIYKYDDDVSAVGFGGEVKYFAEERACDDICDAFRDAVQDMQSQN